MGSEIVLSDDEFKIVVLSQQRVAPQFPFVEPESHRNSQATQAINRTVAEIDGAGFGEIFGWTANLPNFISLAYTLRHDLVIEQEVV